MSHTQHPLKKARAEHQKLNVLENDEEQSTLFTSLFNPHGQESCACIRIMVKGENEIDEKKITFIRIENISFCPFIIDS